MSIMGRSGDVKVDYEDLITNKLTEDESQILMYKNLLQSASFNKILSGVSSSTPEDGYVKSVDFDGSTNTFTFTYSDDSVLVAKVNVKSGEIDLSNYALKSSLESEVTRATNRENEIEFKIPDVSGLASKDDIYTKEEIDSKGYLTEHQDISGLASMDWVLSQGYSTEASSYDDTEIRELIDKKADSDMVVNKYATRDELNSKIAAIESSLQWKDNVVTFDDIAKLYPNPNEGDTVYVDDEGATYRFNGTEWVVVAISSVPVASDESNGLMTSAMFKKLNGLENYDDSVIQGNMTSLLSKMNALENRLSDLSKTNVEAVEISSDVTNLTDPTKDYVLTGTVSNVLSVSGNSVTLNGVEVTNDSRLKVSVDDSAEFRSVVISGEFPKSSGNTVISISDATYVTFKDMTFTSTQYNGVEIGLSGTKLAKFISFTNCRFAGTFSNNAILIFGTDDNAVVDISNCVFEDVSNALRLSNRTNVHCTVNVTNCTVNKWESSLAYTGFLLCQDYTSVTTEEAERNNLFGDGKITVNFVNLIKPDGTKLEVSDASTVCGTKDENQLVYIYRNASNSVLSYNSEKYPVINVI